MVRYSFQINLICHFILYIKKNNSLLMTNKVLESYIN